MKLRALIYPISALAFAPALILLIVGAVVLPQLIVSLGHRDNGSWVLIALIAGGFAGFASAFLVTFDVAGNSLVKSRMWLKRLGIVAGILCLLPIAFIVGVVDADGFLLFWFPPLIGGFLLLLLSFFVGAEV